MDLGEGSSQIIIIHYILNGALVFPAESLYMIIVLHKSAATPKSKEIGEDKGWQGKDSPKIQCPQVS